MNYKYLIFIGLFFFTSCELPTKYGVYYWNNARYDIYTYAAYGFGNSTAYPDTSIFFEKVSMRIKPDSYIIFANWSPIENIVDDIPSDTLSIYYFHSDTLAKYTWEEIQQNYNILKRYDLSKEDIIKLSNGNNVPTIPYPPDERMKNMKMYPPYGKK